MAKKAYEKGDKFFRLNTSLTFVNRPIRYEVFSEPILSSLTLSYDLGVHRFVSLGAFAGFLGGQGPVIARYMYSSLAGVKPELHLLALAKPQNNSRFDIYLAYYIGLGVENLADDENVLIFNSKLAPGARFFLSERFGLGAELFGPFNTFSLNASFKL